MTPVEWNLEAPRRALEVTLDEKLALDEILYLWRRGFMRSNEIAQSVFAYHWNEVDATHSTTFKFWLPSTTTKIVEMSLRLALLPFRATSVTAAAGGGATVTSESGGGQTSSSGGNHTHDVDMGAHFHLIESAQADTDTVSDHHHHYVAAASVTTQYDQGTKTSVANGSHTHTVSSHTHDLALSNHTHAAVYGIYEDTSATGVTVTINGVDRTAALGGGAGFTADQNKLDINRPGWLTFGVADANCLNTIVLTSTQRGRVQAQLDGLVMRTIAM